MKGFCICLTKGLKKTKLSLLPVITPSNDFSATVLIFIKESGICFFSEKVNGSVLSQMTSDSLGFFFPVNVMQH